MQYRERLIATLKILISLPFLIVSVLPFASFTVFVAMSQWVAFMLPLFILSMLYFFLYGLKFHQVDNSAIVTLVVIFVGVAFNVILQNALSFQIYFIALMFAFGIQFVHGVTIFLTNRKKIKF